MVACGGDEAFLWGGVLRDKMFDVEAAAESSSSSSSGRHSRKRHSGRGAIIESMHHHGKGVYSGTFSGRQSSLLLSRSGD